MKRIISLALLTIGISAEAYGQGQTPKVYKNRGLTIISEFSDMGFIFRKWVLSRSDIINQTATDSMTWTRTTYFQGSSPIQIRDVVEYRQVPGTTDWMAPIKAYRVIVWGINSQGGLIANTNAMSPSFHGERSGAPAYAGRTISYSSLRKTVRQHDVTIVIDNTANTETSWHVDITFTCRTRSGATVYAVLRQDVAAGAVANFNPTVGAASEAAGETVVFMEASGFYSTPFLLEP